LGYAVTIQARELPPNTTSNIAAAIWLPYKIAPEDKATEWSMYSYKIFEELAQDKASGVAIKQEYEIFETQHINPQWATRVNNFRNLLPEELPEGCISGYSFDTPVIDTSIYIEYLVKRFQKLGGTIVQREITSLETVLEENPLVVNCTGLGSRFLLNDSEVFPIRGQIVKIELVDLPNCYSVDHKNGLTSYIIVRSKDCVLGGTTEVENWSLEVDRETANNIIERCAKLAPQVKAAKIITHLVGLRPGRTSVRLEAEHFPGGGYVVHNYGHGGAGVTVSWGCAAEVAELVKNKDRTLAYTTEE
jgi:D-amino-acid oxidase